MKEETHYIQDACEKLAVALIQKELEDKNRAISKSSKSKHQDFLQYIEDRDITEDQIRADEYYKTCETHIPNFVENFISTNHGLSFDVLDTEVEGRINNKKTDFAFIGSDGRQIHYSLKNYKGGIRRPQVCSGTFNSFICNFLLEQAGVGMYKDPSKLNSDGSYLDSADPKRRFRSSDTTKRNAALTYLGYEECLPLIGQLDNLQIEMREKVLNSGEFAIFDEDKWKELCGRIGNAGADLTLKIFELIDQQLITARILKSTGIIGNEELLAITKQEFLDSYTNKRFHLLRANLSDPEVKIDIARAGQSINFSYSLHDKNLLKVTVPFTINSNGAWHRDVPMYSGEQVIRDKGHLVSLKYGQLRPYKSREIATSINTYLELTPTGIFDE